MPYEHAMEVLEHINGELYHSYYEGIVFERWGRAQFSREVPFESVANWIRRAMRRYEKAIELAEADDPDPLLRWNTCVRFLNEHEAKELPASPQVRDIHEEFGGDVPLR